MMYEFKYFSPELFLGPNWSIWEEDKRSLEDLSEENFLSLPLQLYVTTEKELNVLKMQEGIILPGANVFLTLWADTQINKKESFLSRQFKNTSSTIKVYFPGTVLKDPDGMLAILYLYNLVTGEWVWHYYWIKRDLSVKRDLPSNTIPARDPSLYPPPSYYEVCPWVNPFSSFPW